MNFSLIWRPVRIQVRIDPPHPLVSPKRRLNGGGGVPSNETGKTEVPRHSRCGTIKIPPCSKALSAEHRPKFCSPSPAIVTSPYKRNILERDVKSITYMETSRIGLNAAFNAFE
jgi:hypothetical protein